VLGVAKDFVHLCRVATKPPVRTYDDLATSLFLATGMKPHTMLGIMRTLVSVLFKKDLKEFDRLRKKLEKLGRQRDIIAHAQWQRPFSLPEGSR